MTKTPTIESDTVWLLRVANIGTRVSRYWIIYNKREVLRGRSTESKSSVFLRWKNLYGPFKRVVRYRGLCNPGEAAATISHDMIEES